MGLGLKKEGRKKGKKSKQGHSSHRKHKQALGLLLLLLLLLRIAPNLGNGSCLGAAPVPTGSAVGSARCYQSGYKFNILRAPNVPPTGGPRSCTPNCSRRVDAGKSGFDWQALGAAEPSKGGTSFAESGGLGTHTYPPSFRTGCRQSEGQEVRNHISCLQDHPCC